MKIVSAINCFCVETVLQESIVFDPQTTGVQSFTCSLLALQKKNFQVNNIVPNSSILLIYSHYAIIQVWTQYDCSVGTGIIIIIIIIIYSLREREVNAFMAINHHHDI